MTAPAGRPAGADVTVEVLGTRFRVGATSDDAGRALADLLAPFATGPAPVPASRHLVVVDGCDAHGAAVCVHRGGAAVLRARDAGAAVAWVLAEVNAAALDGYQGFAVHAGVVARGGRAVAFPGESGAGKSTLTAAAVAAGFAYLSDEALCLRFGTGDVEPYPRAVALSPWSRHHAGLDAVPAHRLSADEVAIPPAALAAGPPPSEVRLAHVVRLVRRPGPPVLVEAGADVTMAELVRHSFNHYKRPRESFELCADLARRARAWHLELSDPAAAAALLFDRLGGR